jgi:IMP dehydrogenase
MTPIEISLRIAAGLFLILINAYFVAIEFALTRVRQFPESEFDTPGLRRAWEMTNDLELYLTTCQIWISGTSIALGIVAEPGLAALFEPLFENTFLASVGAGSFLGFFLINMLHLTHGEQTPTYLGVERSKQVARYGAGPLYWFAWLISPLIKFGDWVAKATLKLFGVEMTGAWLETEEEVLETRAQLRNRLNDMLEEVEVPEERRVRYSMPSTLMKSLSRRSWFLVRMSLRSQRRYRLKRTSTVSNTRLTRDFRSLAII